MFTIPATGPVDDLGRLVHEDDAAAQLALAMARLEDAVLAAGFDLADLTTLRVLTTDRTALDQVYDVLTDRLTAVGADPVVVIADVERLPLPGMVVALEADPYLSGLNDEKPTPKEER